MHQDQIIVKVCKKFVKVKNIHKFIKTLAATFKLEFVIEKSYNQFFGHKCPLNGLIFK